MSEREQNKIDYVKDRKRFNDRIQNRQEALVAAYGLIWSDYMTKAMHERIEEHPDYDAKIKQNPVELLLAIKHSMHETIRAEYPYVSMTDAWSSLINVRQQPEEKLMDYIKRFKQICNMLVAQVKSERHPFQVDHYDPVVERRI
jgi:uncharacterized FlaG/YvyC family protein